MFLENKAYRSVRESELKLERALDSAVLIHDIRAILNSTTEGRAEWVPEVILWSIGLTISSHIHRTRMSPRSGAL